MEPSPYLSLFISKETISKTWLMEQNFSFGLSYKTESCNFIACIFFFFWNDVKTASKSSGVNIMVSLSDPHVMRNKGVVLSAWFSCIVPQ